MNKTKKNVLLTAAITLLLVMGTAITPIQSYASEEHKKNGDLKSSIKSDTEVDKKSANQHQDQDNFCYRGDDCEQANQGQQIVGKDNAAKGFNDQSLNVQQAATTTPNATPNATPVNGTTPTPIPTTGTLNVCKTVVNEAQGATFQPSDFTFNFITPANPSTFQGNNEGCTTVTVAPGTYTFTETIPSSVTDRSISLPDPGPGDCDFVSGPSLNPVTFNGTVAAGETETCSITNTIRGVNTGG
jgi:hypothetical protein